MAGLLLMEIEATRAYSVRPYDVALCTLIQFTSEPDEVRLQSRIDNLCGKNKC